MAVDFDCGHCMAVCTKGAITLKKYEDMQDEIEEYRQRDVPISYDDMLQFYKQRRSMRWFKDKKIDRETFDKLFESVYNSPTAENAQDVEFIVINDEKRLNDFMHLVYDIIKVREDEFFRIERLRDYLCKTAYQCSNSYYSSGAYGIHHGPWRILFTLDADG